MLEQRSTPSLSRFATACCGVAILASCTAQADLSVLENHIIALDTEGRPVHYRDEDRLSPEEYESRVVEMLEVADQACSAQWQSASQQGQCADYPTHTRKLLIHVHGGLNDRETSLRAAKRSVEAMQKDEFDDWHYPIFVSWPSGGPSSYAEHLVKLRGGLHTPLRAKLSAPLFLAADLARGVARFPRTLYYGAVTDAQVGIIVAFGKNPGDDWERASVAYDYLDGQRQDGGIGPLYDVSRGDYARGFWNQAGRFTKYLLTLPLTIPITALVIDGMGESAWQTMKHRATNAAHTSREFEWKARDDPDFLQQSLTRQADGGFSIFLRHLMEHIERETQGAGEESVRYEITFVAHSMGAFLINDALSRFPELPVKNIVYMAPACSIGEGTQAIVPYLLSHNQGLPEERQANFYLLTLHPIAEQDERNYFDLTPRGSLLEWIDNWYQNPASHLERRFGKWLNVLSSLHLFHDVRDNFHVKAFGVQGDSMPQKHGQFNLCPFWRQEFWEPTGPKYYYDGE